MRVLVMRHAGRHRNQRVDAGFTVIEVLVSITVFSIALGAMLPFFVTAMRATNYQRDRRVAIQLATDALEEVRGLGGAVLTGRAQSAVQHQWANPAPGVGASLAILDPAYTDPGTDPTSQPVLPYSRDVVPANGLSYRQHWYVGRCAMAEGADDCTRSATGTPYLRVVVAVTWPESACPSGTCSYVTETLLAGLRDEPVFPSNGTNP